jgi:hypothetical protein
MAWKPIILSAKVFGHISQGLYRTPAGAIKELVSNAYDADATIVRIHTDFPRFETFSCEDNGRGMSRNEFIRLMERGIGNSAKRSDDAEFSEIHQRPLIGRLGLGILSLAQICTQFEIVSHHRQTESAFRVIIKFPPYTREEMDSLSRSTKVIKGGEYLVSELTFDQKSQGVKIFTKNIREQFRKRLRSSLSLSHANVKSVRPYKTFDQFINTIYHMKKPVASLNLRSEYDQLLFGLALAPPIPLIENRNAALYLPTVRRRQSQAKKYDFQLQVDNLNLLNPVCLPSDKDGHGALSCRIGPPKARKFEIKDGSFRDTLEINQYAVSVEKSDVTFQFYEIEYNSANVAGRPLAFSGYLFQQVGRLYPRDIQGVLIRLHNVAIGKYDNSMLTYPYAEGPRYSMISSEIFVNDGFDDALNIDRDSFNELHPHYVRTQAYLHALLHELIFPETWTEEKRRNRRRREKAAKQKERSFFQHYGEVTGQSIRSIERTEMRQEEYSKSEVRASPVVFDPRHKAVELDVSHPLLAPLLRRKKYAALVEKLAIAFERANNQGAASARRELFYQLLTEVFAD